ncbi:NAD-dependent epimerase/dehydratase family protein [Parasphingorhabdus cellanae]|uniref:NAD-dependent epimerase/dehydratase family protein n=1 Tax=Parasphingorhabdus cellanae TaxID=2806553 RepID=A0ABX7T236_9SPHN|nr:NAD-dependent epimerase/dehydratase family protein [Parasphingorhabdus cellanae]QTD54847.1 NAD-dependent epimerase/dehydratase family protein [Parasphingorhabdus cellanae]
MKIAIAGSSGFVGSSIRDAIRKRGHKVHVITRSELEQKPEDLRLSLGQCDWVINCAGSTRIGNAVDRRANTHLPAELYDKLHDCITDGYLHISSVAAIGSVSQPGEWITEDYVESPNSEYGHTKLEGDKRLRNLGNSGIKICILRPPILYGAKAGGVFGILRKCALNGLPLPFANLSNLRHFMFIDNFAGAVVAAIEAQLEGIYITVDHEPLSPARIYDLMTTIAGKGTRTFSLGPIVKPILKLLLRSRASSLLDDACYQDAKFKRQTGYVPSYSMREAFEITMRPY